MKTNQADRSTGEFDAPSSWIERASWCMFDFANSAFVTIMITAFYSRFFVDVIARGHPNANTLWGTTIAISMAIVAISSPLLGAVADSAGNKKLMLRLYVLVNVLACGALGFVAPGSSSSVILALLLVAVANVAFEGAYVFYNAFLPELVGPGRVGRLSGYGWAVGYLGGLGCLALVYGAGWVPKSYDTGVPSSALRVPLAVAAWYALFALPMLLLVKERATRATTERASESYVSKALEELKASVAVLKSHPDLRRFLFSYFLFTNAPTTVIIFTGTFTGEALHFTPQETIRLFLLLNVVAAPGALAFGYIVDRIGGVWSVGLSLALWVVVVVGSMLVHTKGTFWFIAVIAAVGLGATQSASRSVVAKLVPRTHTNRIFGLMTVAGKSSAIAGPILYGVVRDSTGNPRMAVGSMLIFLLGGVLLLARVNEKRGLAQVNELRSA